MNQDLEMLKEVLDRFAKSGSIHPEMKAEEFGNEYRIYYPLFDKLSDVQSDLKYLEKEVVSESVLERNSEGRFESKGVIFASGTRIEYQDDEGMWCLGRVEYDSENGDYYIYEDSDIKMLGLKVRTRG